MSLLRGFADRVEPTEDELSTVFVDRSRERQRSVVFEHDSALEDDAASDDDA